MPNETQTTANPSATPEVKPNLATTTVATDTSMMPSNTMIVASSIGALAGLGYAFYTKKKFWGYVGFFVLGSLAGSLAGNILSKKK